MWENHLCREKMRSESCLPKLPPNTSYWKRILRNLRKLIIVSERNERVSFFLRSHAAILAEKRRHIFSKNYYIIHPFSLFRKYWEIFMTFVYLLFLFNNAFFLTFSAMLREENYHMIELFWYVNMVNIIVNIDFILNFFTGYIRYKTKEIILDHKRIILHYLQTFFIVDVLSFTSIYNMVIFMFRIKPGNSNYVTCVKYLTIFRLKTIVEYMKWITDALKLGETSYTACKTVVVSLYLLHFNSCLVCLVSNLALLYNPNANLWVKQIENNYMMDNATLTVISLYFHSIMETMYIYNSHTITITVAETTEDLIMEIITIGCGIVLRIWIIMVIYGIMKITYNSSISYQIKMREVDLLIQHKDLSERTIKELKMFYSNHYHNHYYNEKSLLRKMSRPLKYEIFIECSKGLIENCSLFRRFPKTMIISIAHNMRLEMFFPGEYIYKCGDVANCMYLLAYGSVCIFDSNGIEITHLRDGDYFGETALMWDAREMLRETSVVVLELSEIYILDRDIFKDLISMNPDLADEFKQSLIRRNKL